MAADVPGRGEGRAARHGGPQDMRLRDQGSRGSRGGRRRNGQALGDGALRDRERVAAQELVSALPRGRC